MNNITRLCKLFLELFPDGTAEDAKAFAKVVSMVFKLIIEKNELEEV